MVPVMVFPWDFLKRERSGRSPNGTLDYKVANPHQWNERNSGRILRETTWERSSVNRHDLDFMIINLQGEAPHGPTKIHGTWQFQTYRENWENTCRYLCTMCFGRYICIYEVHAFGMRRTAKSPEKSGLCLYTSAHSLHLKIVSKVFIAKRSGSADENVWQKLCA